MRFNDFHPEENGVSESEQKTLTWSDLPTLKTLSGYSGGNRLRDRDDGKLSSRTRLLQTG